MRTCFVFAALCLFAARADWGTASHGPPDENVIAVMQRAHDEADEKIAEAIHQRNAAYESADPNFWARTLFSAMNEHDLVHTEDHFIFKSLRKLRVEEVPDSSSMSFSPMHEHAKHEGIFRNEFTIELTFDKSNPYFEQTTLWRRVKPTSTDNYMHPELHKYASEEEKDNLRSLDAQHRAVERCREVKWKRTAPNFGNLRFFRNFFDCSTGYHDTPMHVANVALLFMDIYKDPLRYYKSYHPDIRPGNFLYTDPFARYVDNPQYAPRQEDEL